MSKVVTFGEIMLRLAPEGYYRIVQAEKYVATYGGGEANVSVSLANYGLDSKFVSKLPKNEIGQAGVNSLRKFGVDTSDIVRGGNRVGIYYLEKERASVLPRLFMTVRDPPSQRRLRRTLTGIRFLKARTGSILQELLPPLEIILQRSVWKR